MARGRSIDPDTRDQVREFAKYEVGQSFFVEGARVEDLEYLRAPAQRLGLGISICHFDQDPIYFVPGVRVYRKEGACDLM